MSLDRQFYLFIHTILYGVFLGLSFDTFELFCQWVKKKIIRDILIILFWAMQLPLAVLLFHRVNRGEFQSYLLIFVLLGGWIYFKILKKKYIQDLKTLIQVCHQVYKWIKKVLNVLFFKPIAFIFRIVFDIINIPKKFFRKKRSGKDKERLQQDGAIESNKE
jgi:spore cortex biosynthesis protein YabQ